MEEAEVWFATGKHADPFFVMAAQDKTFEKVDKCLTENIWSNIIRITR